MTSAGHSIYVRYRWGYLSVSLSSHPSTDPMEAVDGLEVFGIEHGDGLDGCLSYSMLVKLTEGFIEWPGEDFSSLSDEIVKIHEEDNERGGGE